MMDFLKYDEDASEPDCISCAHLGIQNHTEMVNTVAAALDHFAWT